MGGDGGVIATQRKFLRAAKDGKDVLEIERKQTQELQEQRAYLCAFTTEKLEDRIVACKLGNLYNKEKLLEGIIDKSLQFTFPHIRGLRDIKDLSFTKNSNDSAVNPQKSKYICPITHVEFNGLHPFVFIWTTGIVLSEKAIREIGIEHLQDEFGPFMRDDIIRLLPSDEEQTQIKSQLEEKYKQAKKDKKPSKKRTHESSTDPLVEEPSNESIGAKKKISKAEAIVSHANKTVELQSSNSNVFKNLFHNGSDSDLHDRDLFMSVAGIRYTLR